MTRTQAKRLPVLVPRSDQIATSVLAPTRIAAAVASVFGRAIPVLVRHDIHNEKRVLASVFGAR